jgi:hypothetical protein
LISPENKGVRQTPERNSTDKQQTQELNTKIYQLNNKTSTTAPHLAYKARCRKKNSKPPQGDRKDGDKTTPKQQKAQRQEGYQDSRIKAKESNQELHKNTDKRQTQKTA